VLTSHIARFSKDGRDLVVLFSMCRVAFIRDFGRIFCGETSLERAVLVLGIPHEFCCNMGFEDGRICVEAVRISQAPLVIVHVDVDL
jgi:hypothetical protein